VVNRSRTEAAELVLDVADAVGAGPTAYTLVEHLVIHDDDASATNTEANPDRVAPRPGDASVEMVDGPTLTATLPPTSWHCIRLTEGTVR
jgi:alpha-N-arabinofuranosidase